ncbi:hypothetical protein Hamer_G009438 [Homarus americanus]|uniref:Integrase p58-like C-terminal domain-containing protein n=1 Tax=Homarus americanus TaxID=6706 RepID=A0A8J5MJG9_HOMAM|nr:hypothetical protein Hamer_G009438 [Homarus americanus]
MKSVEKSGKYDERVEKGSAELYYRSTEFRPQATSSEVVNYPREPVKEKPQKFDGKVSWEANQAQFELLVEQNGAYPGASPDLLAVLLRDQFVDALDSTQVKIQVKLSQPVTLQEALARALEFESYVTSSLPNCRTESRTPLLTKCNRATVSSVQVEGEIDGIRCPLVIDTTSERTFVRPDVVSPLQLPEMSQQLCGITEQCEYWTLARCSWKSKETACSADGVPVGCPRVNWLHTGKTDAESRTAAASGQEDHLMKNFLKKPPIMPKASKKEGSVTQVADPLEGPYTVVERDSSVTYRIMGRRKAQPKVVHANRLWQYHGPGQYTWEDSGEQSPTTDEDQAGNPGRNQDRTDPGNPTMDQEEEHCSLLVELGVTEDQSEDVTEVAAPREDSEDIPVRRRQQLVRRPTKFQDYYLYCEWLCQNNKY